MSADRYSICPNCVKIRESKLMNAQRELINRYGKISAEEWLAENNSLEKEQNEELENTLRQDWELDMSEDGLFIIRYSCSCHICGFKYEFKHEETVELSGVSVVSVVEPKKEDRRNRRV